ncbi:monothiol glutaredoxin-S2-like [Cornus florida]|uniref:monothiol glutaredoxin-S2-like n=1 Tax=Cornus florida TaxID=4283 RepID=UPI00289836FC|nr:monothiol glutaredoxin-S2-like [Cornus florida]XP_059655105.1 monothiol glutaredoxin-S2-like [Cornus florida]XP_059655109.1 monothiol glutaredoxin-S2-like [Cornus florida]
MEGVTTMVSQRPLVIFTKRSCCMSDSIITFFRNNFGANPAIHDLDQIQRGREMEKALSRLGYDNVPVVFIGGELVGGVNEVTSRHVEGSLVPMLRRAGAIFV